MSGSREEERRKLADIINHWNANRLDLFEISRPTEVGGRGQGQERPGGGGEGLSGANGGQERRYRLTLGSETRKKDAVVGSESSRKSPEKCADLQCHDKHSTKSRGKSSHFYTCVFII